MNKDNQTLLKAKEEVALTNTKFTVDQQVFERSTCHWQSKGKEMKRRISQLVSENEQLYSENQQLIEANELLVIDSQLYRPSRKNWTWP
jgi:hypothetical protein